MSQENHSFSKRLEDIFFPCASRIERVVSDHKRECDEVICLVKQNANKIRKLVMRAK